ncbi:MAG: queuosine precursor transporter [Kofleriaceae bacterium]
MTAVKLDARLTLFVTLVAIFMTCLVVGDLIGGKLTSITLFGREWVFSAGQLAFPVTFILTDILNEFYGRQVARKVTVLAFCMVGMTLAIIACAGQLPWASFTADPKWDGVTPREFQVVFSQAMWIQVSSMFAFLIGNFVDISVFFLFKKLTGDRMLWLRATGSTAISQLIDTVLINALVWGAKVAPSEYLSLVLGSYAVKIVVAVAVTPVIYALHGVIERWFHVEPDSQSA